RSLGERGFAVLKTWRILRRLRTCPWRAGPIVAAILTLEHL
ncbi:MAG TPA: IS5/IS1182 family transposase, partial [Frankiaceae bacterium]|nr:IS5/IS1182 family transposase [Frankiaceae bacterium]HWL35477.1 IS5/IS1182 family transposase [Frankiaceae bacterium]